VRTFNSPDEVVAAVGQQLGQSPWRRIEPARIAQFNAALGGSVETSAGMNGSAPQSDGGVAPSSLVLALVPMFLREIVAFPFRKMGVNYGLNRVRFPVPMQPGSSVRGVVSLVSAEVLPGCLQVVARVTLETEGCPDPVCVAEAVTRHYF
jgi:acyl dehydratase